MVRRDRLAVASDGSDPRQPDHIYIIEANANMTGTIIRAKRTPVEIGIFIVNGLMMPDGSYRMSDTNACEAIGEPTNSLSNWRKSEGFKALLEAGSVSSGKPQKVKVEGERQNFNASELKVVRRYWLSKASSNPEAAKLCDALMDETLERRFDRAFGVKRTEEERDNRLKMRMLDFPCPGEPAFEDWFEREVAKVTGLHKNDIRNGKFYWEFVYYWLTEEERAKLNEINPVLPNGRRKYKIHDCLTPETKIRLAPFQLKLMGKLESANSVDELRRMMQRASGIDQPSLFDGWDWNKEGDKSA